MSKLLTGEDATLLALLAQAPRMPKKEQAELIESLAGPAKKIAKAIVGRAPDKRSREVADAFLEWASQLRR
jgi:hypothetical protein